MWVVCKLVESIVECTIGLLGSGDGNDKGDSVDSVWRGSRQVGIRGVGLEQSGGEGV